MTEQKETNLKGLYLLLLVVCILTVLVCQKACKKTGEVQVVSDLYEHIDDSAKYYKNKYDQAVTSISLLQGEKVEQLLAIKSSNETIKWLQQEVKRNEANIKSGGNVTVIGSETTFNGTSSTTISFPVNDSVPVYQSDSKDTTWVKYHITASEDSTHLELKVKNKYSVIIGEEKVKGKLFKKTPIAYVVNENPYTSITQMKAFSVTNKTKKRVSIGLNAGYGLPLISFKPQPYIGIGINYNIINLW